MNHHQITLVQSSFDHVAPIADRAATLFYARLFELDATLRPLFPNDLAAQKAKLMHTLTLVMRGLTNLEKLVPAVEQLGMRHAGYGVQTDHYQTVGAALLWTLEQGLGSLYTAEVAKAWTAAYTLLAGVMQQAAAQVENSTAAA
jgi:hemoglobin-like flavoprotein